ncbi:carbohydrate ABC transporter permease [Caproicibacter sp.]|uniref:carbohydrate ABC transporter permease n=1 Tax=Caproicibacter sp. TaxID=2814884 RepID=UPI003988C2E9
MTDNAAAAKGGAARHARKTVLKILRYAVLTLIAAIFAGPFLWLLITSFRTGANLYDLNLLVGAYSLDNFVGVVKFMNIPQYIVNTLIITVGAIAIDVVFSSLCAYPLAMMKFPGKKAVFGILVALMIVPAAAGLVITYLTITYMHLLNTFMGCILPCSVGAFSIILLRQAYFGIPKELMDAAKIDGAGELKIWSRIMLPEIKPTVTTVIIFDFIGNWNQFLWPVIIMQDPQKYPLATALQYLNGMFNYKFGYIAAGTIISIIPVILVFLCFQKNYIEAVAGAVKG